MLSVPLPPDVSHTRHDRIAYVKPCRGEPNPFPVLPKHGKHNIGFSNLASVICELERSFSECFFFRLAQGNAALLAVRASSRPADTGDDDKLLRPPEAVVYDDVDTFTAMASVGRAPQPTPERPLTKHEEGNFTATSSGMCAASSATSRAATPPRIAH